MGENVRDRRDLAVADRVCRRPEDAGRIRRGLATRHGGANRTYIATRCQAVARNVGCV